MKYVNALHFHMDKTWAVEKPRCLKLLFTSLTVI